MNEQAMHVLCVINSTQAEQQRSKSTVGLEQLFIAYESPEFGVSIGQMVAS